MHLEINRCGSTTPPAWTMPRLRHATTLGKVARHEQNLLLKSRTGFSNNNPLFDFGNLRIRFMYHARRPKILAPPFYTFHPTPKGRRKYRYDVHHEYIKRVSSRPSAKSGWRPHVLVLLAKQIVLDAFTHALEASDDGDERGPAQASKTPTLCPGWS